MSSSENNSRIIFHIDMDAFFAAVEQRDHPEYRGKPVVIGAPPDQRGVVSTASYEARRYGIHSALPSRTAYERCPHAVFLPVRRDTYITVSNQVMDILYTFTPWVEKVSIDEAFMDLSGCLQDYNASKATAQQLKDAVRGKVGLTCSVGVGPNKFLAKLASDMDKPDALTIVPHKEADIQEFLAPLPVSSIWGVGKITAERLAKFRIRYIADLQKYRMADLQRMLGENLGTHLFELSMGRDDRPVITEHEEKSVSNEHTFPEDCSDKKEIQRKLLQLTEKVGYRLRQNGKTASTGVIKIRYEDFTTITRQQSLGEPTNNDRHLINCALSLFRNAGIKRPVRLIGFGATNLHDESEVLKQPLLFNLSENEEKGDGNYKDSALDKAVDELRKRYGPDIIKRSI